MSTAEKIILLPMRDSHLGDANVGIRPWLDRDGAILSDDILRAISKTWSADTWEEFLVETVEKSGSYTREDLVNPRAYAAALDEMMESIWD